MTEATFRSHPPPPPTTTQGKGRDRYTYPEVAAPLPRVPLRQRTSPPPVEGRQAPPVFPRSSCGSRGSRSTSRLKLFDQSPSLSQPRRDRRGRGRGEAQILYTILVGATGYAQLAKRKDQAVWTRSSKQEREREIAMENSPRSQPEKQHANIASIRQNGDSSGIRAVDKIAARSANVPGGSGSSPPVLPASAAGAAGLCHTVVRVWWLT